MPALSELLASAPALEWIEANVLRINGDYLTLDYLGGEVDNVSYLTSYTPGIGDTIQAISQSGRGILVLGKAQKTGAGMAPLPTPTSSTVVVESIATFHTSASGSAWETGVFAQTGPSDYGVWLYDIDLLAAVSTDMLTQFEIEVNMSAGGPAEFFLHDQPGASGALHVLSPGRYVTSWTPLGALTWVPLPVGWGEDLIAGRAKGIGAGGGLFTATWVAGGGRLRFTGV